MYFVGFTNSYHLYFSMVNATNLNIANIGGKQVIIASKSATPNSAAGNFVIGSHTLGNLISQVSLNIFLVIPNG